MRMDNSLNNKDYLPLDEETLKQVDSLLTNIKISTENLDKKWSNNVKEFSRNYYGENNNRDYAIKQLFKRRLEYEEKLEELIGETDRYGESILEMSKDDRFIGIIADLFRELVKISRKFTLTHEVEGEIDESVGKKDYTLPSDMLDIIDKWKKKVMAHPEIHNLAQKKELEEDIEKLEFQLNKLYERKEYYERELGDENDKHEELIERINEKEGRIRQNNLKNREEAEIKVREEDNAVFDLKEDLNTTESQIELLTEQLRKLSFIKINQKKEINQRIDEYKGRVVMLNRKIRTRQDNMERILKERDTIIDDRNSTLLKEKAQLREVVVDLAKTKAELNKIDKEIDDLTEIIERKKAKLESLNKDM